MTAHVVRPRWPRVVGGVWLAAGALMLVAAVVALPGGQGVVWEWLVGVVALLVGWWLWRRELVVDELGIEQAVGWRRSRLLWPVVEAVVVQPGGPLVAPVRLQLRGRDAAVLRASLGVSARQRADLVAQVRAAAREVGVPVREDGSAAGA